MVYRGRVCNGVIVLDDKQGLPEGAPVTVFCDFENVAPKENAKTRLILPLVASERPGSMRLTADLIAEALEGEDVSSGH